MVSRNDITGDTLKSRANSRAYRDNWDNIFGKKITQAEKRAERSAAAAKARSEEINVERDRKSVV